LSTPTSKKSTATTRRALRQFTSGSANAAALSFE
jgi:hypothetical protein